MEIIKEIYHKDIGLDHSKDPIKYEIRKAARAVLFNEDNKIALMYVGKDSYYKLPGGGVEKGETINEALSREIMEEVGSDLEIISELGLVIEHREHFVQKQMSYNFLCKTRGKLQKPGFSERELKNEFNLKWYSLDKAIELVNSYKGDKYLAKLITLRDFNILKKAEEIIKKI